MAPPALAIPRRGEQAIDEPLVCGRAVVMDERRDLFRGRREPGQVEGQRGGSRCAGPPPAAGVKSLAACAASRKRSIGVRANGPAGFPGGCTGRSGRNDQCSRSAAVTVIAARTCPALASASGQVAPSATQRLSRATSSAGSRSLFGGIRKVESSEETRWSRVLASGSRGTIARLTRVAALEGRGTRVKPQSAPLLFGTVALEAVARKQRTDLGGEIDRSGVIARRLVTGDRVPRQRGDNKDSKRAGEDRRRDCAKRTRKTMMTSDRHVAIPP